MHISALRDLIESSDLAGLVRAVENLVGDQDWNGIEQLRDWCREAVERGKQLWGIAQFAEYRMALEAPPQNAGAVVREGAGRDALGPLWEVASSTHTWSELAPHIVDPRSRTLVAHERAIRGDEVDATDLDLSVIDVPLEQELWEPRYPVAKYFADRAAFPESDLPDMSWVELDGPEESFGGSTGSDALLDLAQVWVDQSSGRSEARAVSGSALHAIRSFGIRRARITSVSFADALARMVWVGASGGAYGRRRGTPVGRASAWWAIACLAGIEDDWPVLPRDLGEVGSSLKWYLWDPGDAVGGWNFHLAVEDPIDGLAWAVSAVDWK